MLFISFEGTEGVGKTSTAKLVTQKLYSAGYDVLLTREPGGTKIADEIRTIILNKDNTNLDYWAEAFLYIAARKQHLKEELLPALAKQKIVICDRYMDSTSAYQGAGRKLGVEIINKIQEIANIKKPDLTFFFDINPQIGLERAFKNRTMDELNRLDLEISEFYADVYKGYKTLIADEKRRFIIIDAQLKQNEIIDNITKIIIDKIVKLKNEKSSSK